MDDRSGEFMESNIANDARYHKNITFSLYQRFYNKNVQKFKNVRKIM